MPPAPPPPKSSASNKAAPTQAKTKIAFQRGIKQRRGTAVAICAVEGFGKTTMAAYSNNPLMLMARNELGYQKLLEFGLVPEIDYTVCESWIDTLSVLDQLIADDAGHKTICLDAISGFEQLCHEEVCRRDFKGDFADKFLAYGKGPHVAVQDWLQLIARLERLQGRGVNIILLSHIKVKPFKNPTGEDYDRYTNDCHDKTWEPTRKWLDAILFGNFYTTVEDDGGRAKGIGGTDRIIYTERRAAWDAKNRMNMPESIDIPNDPALAWSTIAQHMEAK